MLIGMPLRRKVHNCRAAPEGGGISAAGEAESATVARLQADLDHEVVIQEGREKELERLRGELEDSGLQEAGAELHRKESELQQKETELLAT